MASTTEGCRVFLGNSKCVSAIKGNTFKVIWMLGLRVFFCVCLQSATYCIIATTGMDVLHAEIDKLLVPGTVECISQVGVLHRGVSTSDGVWQMVARSWLQCMCTSGLWVYPCSAGAYTACSSFPDKEHVIAIIRWAVREGRFLRWDI